VWYNTGVNRTINKWERERAKTKKKKNDRNQFVETYTRTDFFIEREKRRRRKKKESKNKKKIIVSFDSLSYD
jgi:hypothetical protein